jgi:CheY-like chemotaxis protein
VSTHKILVIDDSKVIRMRVRDMLPQGNFEVLEARDGVEGYNMIRSEKPNLILLDWLLPKMGGWEVYQEVQKEYAMKSIPLVLMSGRKEEVTSKISEPFEDKYLVFIEKPFEQKELITAIKRAVVLAQKRPPISVMPMSAATDAIASAKIDDGLIKRIEELEAKQKILEQQVLSQQKQFHSSARLPYT